MTELRPDEVDLETVFLELTRDERRDPGMIGLVSLGAGCGCAHAGS